MPQEDKEKMPEKYETVSFDEFESIGIVNAKDKAARFYSVMFLLQELKYYVLHQLRNDPTFVPELDFVHAGCL